MTGGTLWASARRRTAEPIAPDNEAMRDFNIYAFNPQPEPPGDRYGFAGFDPQPEPPRPVGLLLPAVQA